MLIEIHRQAGQKFSESERARNLGKAGRLARMFAKNRAQATACKSRVEGAIALAELPKRRLVEIEYAPVKGNLTAHTIRAKEKIKRGCRELIRI